MKEDEILDSFVPEPNTGCWIWFRATDPRGYGKVRWRERTRFAHSVIWEIIRGPIPIGLEPDHLCRIHCCVNPDHLEWVTHLENIRRGQAPIQFYIRKTHCVHGHEYTADNTYRFGKNKQWRGCNACRRDHVRAHRKRLNETMILAKEKE